MLSPPSTRPSDATERPSSAFVREGSLTDASAHSVDGAPSACRIRRSSSSRRAIAFDQVTPLYREGLSTRCALGGARIPLAIGDSGQGGGAFMEPSGRNRWQPVAKG